MVFSYRLPFTIYTFFSCIVHSYYSFPGLCIPYTYLFISVGFAISGLVNSHNINLLTDWLFLLHKRSFTFMYIQYTVFLLFLGVHLLSIFPTVRYQWLSHPSGLAQSHLVLLDFPHKLFPNSVSLLSFWEKRRITASADCQLLVSGTAPSRSCVCSTFHPLKRC